MSNVTTERTLTRDDLEIVTHLMTADALRGFEWTSLVLAGVLPQRRATWQCSTYQTALRHCERVSVEQDRCNSLHQLCAPCTNVERGTEVAVQQSGYHVDVPLDACMHAFRLSFIDCVQSCSGLRSFLLGGGIVRCACPFADGLQPNLEDAACLACCIVSASGASSSACGCRQSVCAIAG